MKRPTYCKPYTWVLPVPNSANLEQIQGPLPNHSRHTKRPNLTLQQRSTLRKLGSNVNLVIEPFDKGSGICLMDTSLYINKIEQHLADITTYKELDTDPTQAIRNDVLSNLDYLHITNRIDDQTRHHLTPPNPARTPLFYGLPKVHNPNNYSDQYYRHVIASPINFPTTSPISYNHSWRHSPLTSGTTNTSSSS